MEFKKKTHQKKNKINKRKTIAHNYINSYIMTTIENKIIVEFQSKMKRKRKRKRGEERRKKIIMMMMA